MVKRKVTKQREAEPAVPVYFLSLTLENVRCFGPRQTLDLSDGHGRPARWTVILGDNGTGKTSLLRSLLNMVPQPRPSRWPKDEDAASRAVLQPFVVVGEDESSPVRNGSPGSFFQASYGYGALLSDLSGVFHPALLSFSSNCWDILSFGPGSSDPIEKMVLFAYGANRPIGDGSLADYHSDGTRSLTVENSPLIPAEEWLLQQDLLARHGNGDSAMAKQRLETVIRLLKELLPKDDIHDITFKPIDLSPTRQRIAVHVKTPYGEIPLRALSLGYRTLIAWMIDLVLQLFTRYPESKNPLHEPAVVLVDEIDLHLHPKWQRQLFSSLSEKFPNVQFIVTAHSPLIVQAAKDANLYVLHRPSEEADHVVISRQPEEVRFWRIDQILTSDLFALPSGGPPEFDSILQRQEQLLAKAKLTAKESAELEQIDQWLASRGATDTRQERQYLKILRLAAESVQPRKRK